MREDVVNYFKALHQRFPERLANANKILFQVLSLSRYSNPEASEFEARKITLVYDILQQISTDQDRQNVYTPSSEMHV
jgi:hypothetical protein